MILDFYIFSEIADRFSLLLDLKTPFCGWWQDFYSGLICACACFTVSLWKKRSSNHIGKEYSGATSVPVPYT